MNIDQAMIHHLAHLARLEFDEVSQKEMIKDIKRIVAFVEKLSELPVDSVEPLVYLSDQVNVLREDLVKRDISRDEALKNAPQKDSDYFKVPRVVEKK